MQNPTNLYTIPGMPTCVAQDIEREMRQSKIYQAFVCYDEGDYDDGDGWYWTADCGDMEKAEEYFQVFVGV